MGGLHGGAPWGCVSPSVSRHGEATVDVGKEDRKEDRKEEIGQRIGEELARSMCAWGVRVARAWLRARDRRVAGGAG